MLCSPHKTHAQNLSNISFILKRVDLFTKGDAMNDSERSSSPNESRFEKWLMKKLHRVACPDTLELSEYAGGLLSGSAAVLLNVHLETCPKCRQELNFLRAFMAEETVSVDTGSQPDSLVDQFQRPFRRLIALLQDASALSMGRMVLRGAASDQLVYEVEDVQVVIEVLEDDSQPNQKTLIGLVLCDTDKRWHSVQLLHEGIEIAQAAIDELGNFIFSALAPGKVQLILRTDDTEIQLETTI